MELRAIPANLVPAVGVGLVVLGLAAGPVLAQTSGGIGANLSDASATMYPLASYQLSNQAVCYMGLKKN